MGFIHDDRAVICLPGARPVPRSKTADSAQVPVPEKKSFDRGRLYPYKGEAWMFQALILVGPSQPRPYGTPQISLFCPLGIPAFGRKPNLNF
jgi:hypothetical protein